MERHECKNIGYGIFICRACDFSGSLSQVCEHVSKNQFTVKPKIKRLDNVIIYDSVIQRRERSRRPSR